MKIKFLLILLIIFLYNSCDILRISKFEIVSWTPGTGFHSEPENISVSIIFSHEPDRANIERNFSLAGNSVRIKGNFYWSRNRITFTPLTPLEKNTDYVITISAEAHDTKGLSLDKAFNGSFTTRQNEIRPVLISFYPAAFEEINDPYAEVKLYFSLPVSPVTLYNNVSFTPSMTGFWRLEDEDKLAVFASVEPWSRNTRYEIRISDSLSGNNGMTIGANFTSIFTSGTACELPYLVSASRILNNGVIIDLNQDRDYSGVAEQPVENSSVEKDDKLLLVFSKPVDSTSVKNNIISEDGPGLILETSPGYKTDFIFKFQSIPVYESRFKIKIKSGIKDISGNETKEEYVYKIFVNGNFSRPPELAGIRLPMAPYHEKDQKTVFYKSNSLFNEIPITDQFYPSGETIKTWIELYFITAENASINLFSLMDLFQIETSNNVISFSPRYVKQNNYAISEKESGYENYLRIEIEGEIKNTTNFGVIYFQIAAGLLDSLGNKNENLQRIPLLK